MRLTEEEKNQLSNLEINDGLRLACQASPKTDVKIFIPPSSLTHGQQLQLEGEQFQIKIAPAVTALDINFDRDEINHSFDLTRLTKKVNKKAGREITLIKKPLLDSVLGQMRRIQWCSPADHS